MKKAITIILINILLIFIAVFIFNYLYFVKLTANNMDIPYYEVFSKHAYENIYFTLKMSTFDDFYKKREANMFRPVSGEEYTEKKPIILMGCSFAYGHVLDDNKILSARIAEKAKRTVYNFAYPGWGTQNIIYLMQHNQKLQNVKKEGEGKQYIIYWYIYDHLRRLYIPFFFTDTYYALLYTEKNGTLVRKERNHPYIDAFYLIKDQEYKRVLTDYAERTEEMEKYRFFMQHMYRIKEEKDKLFPDAQIIVMSSSEPFPDQVVSDLEAIDIPVLYTKDLTGVDMENDPEWTYDIHPNAAAVELLSDALIKELGL